MLQVQTRNVPEAFSEMMLHTKMRATREDSRNGPVLTHEEPVCVEILRPWERVLFDPVRQANPYFHVMEFIWMMAGSNRVEWIEQFNSGFRAYAEEDGHLHAAYGHRWRHHFGRNQIRDVVQMLRENPGNRRIVMSMWDPRRDLGTEVNDLPCNTQLLFRVVRGKLEMTVTNRSNDIIWGMLGANAVHMTMLHQLISEASGIPQGTYRVFSINAHMYESVPNFAALMEQVYKVDLYTEMGLPPALLLEGTNLETFLQECEQFVVGNELGESHWLGRTAANMHQAYMYRKDGDLDAADSVVSSIDAQDWRLACELWSDWKNG